MLDDFFCSPEKRKQRSCTLISEDLLLLARWNETAILNFGTWRPFFASQISSSGYKLFCFHDALLAISDIRSRENESSYRSYAKWKSAPLPRKACDNLNYLKKIVLWVTIITFGSYFFYNTTSTDDWYVFFIFNMFIKKQYF